MERTFLVNLLGGNGLPPTTILLSVLENKYLLLKSLGKRSLTTKEFRTIMQCPELKDVVNYFNNTSADISELHIDMSANTVKFGQHSFTVNIKGQNLEPKNEGGNVVIPSWAFRVFMSMIGKEEDKRARIIITEVENRFQDLFLSSL